MTRRARLAVFGYFGLCGLVIGVWAASLPALDDRLGLGPGRMGTVLLAVSLGALVSMQGAGRVADRWSSRLLCRASGPIFGLLLLGPALAGSYGLLVASAFVFGLGFGLLEIGMNAHALAVERLYRRPIMSAFHGMWSLGGAVGGLLTAGGLRLGVQTLLAVTSVIAAVLFLVPDRWLLKEDPVPEPVAVGERSGTNTVWLLGVVVFAGAVSEGAAMDWAALHARRVLEAGPELAPLAFTVFSVAMTTMRFLGDRLRGRLGAARTLRLAGALATTGYALVLASPALGLPCALAGWALVGTGLATVVPVVFSSVGAGQGSAGRALALLTTFAYCGLLAGPAVIGRLADATSLPGALVVPTALALFVAAAGPLGLGRRAARQPLRASGEAPVCSPGRPAA